MIMKKRNWQYNVRGNAKKPDSFVLYSARKCTKMHGIEAKKEGEKR